MAIQDETGSGSGKDSGTKSLPVVEARRGRSSLPVVLAEPGDLTGLGPGATASFTEPGAEAAPRSRVFRIPLWRTSTLEVHSSGVPAIYLIEREAIRLRRLRIAEFKKATTVGEAAAGIRGEGTKSGPEGDLREYMNPSVQLPEKPAAKTFVQRFKKLASLW